MKLTLVLSILVLLFGATPALAQEPTPEPGFDMPYNFDPIDYESGETNPVAANIADQLSSVGLINRIGSLAATVWDMLDKFAGGGVLGYFLIIVFGVLVIRWLAAFVFGKPIGRVFDASDGVETFVEAQGTYTNYQLGVEAGRYDEMVRQYENYLKQQNNIMLGPSEDFMGNLATGADTARQRARARRDAIKLNKKRMENFKSNFGKVRRLKIPRF